jgi:UDP-N-acetylglucosamine:LPS N-acetylglucosamine transferase
MKILFVASSGGHLEEISCLYPIACKYDSALVTENGGQEKTLWGDKTYFVPQINRKQANFPIAFLKLFIKARKIINKEKPDVIISTGALMTYPFCVIGKKKKAKIIYIESFARIDSASLTGKLMKNKADLFCVQWNEGLEFFPNAEYIGGIF